MIMNNIDYQEYAKLGKLLNVKVLNKASTVHLMMVLSESSDILRLLTQYKYDELFVIIGWSSTKEKFFYKDEWKTMYQMNIIN